MRINESGVSAVLVERVPPLLITELGYLVKRRQEGDLERPAQRKNPRLGMR